jgi:ABC-2 type transport system ATP-binding protein
MTDFLAKDLSKKYGHLYALRDFNLEIEKGQCVALLGPNGAGKSTLLKISTNIVHPTAGYVEIDGVNVQNDPMGALEKVGPLVELPEFYPYLNGSEILDFVCKVKGANREMVKSEIQRLSEMLKMTDFVDRKCGYYSRGMKQRLALSCAMAMNPEILILDEPTFGLDPRGMREFVDIIKEINKRQGKTVLLSTHLISEAREIADKVIIVSKGVKMIEMKNEREVALVSVSFYDKPDTSKFDPNILSVVEENGNQLTIEPANNAPNYKLADYLRGLGCNIKWIEPTNDIERKYLELVK